MNSPAARALIVEDDLAWQAILRELLEDAGLLVDTSSTLETALAQVNAQPHRVAIVDLSLVGSEPRNQDGLRVLEALRQHDPGCVSILLSGYATVEAAVKAITTHGALTCLQKERFSRSDFRGLLQRALSAPPGDLNAAATGTSINRPEAAPEWKGNALVVEDDAGWRSILAELLSDAGYSVQLCTSYGEALGWLRREKFHLAVVDLSLGRAISTNTPAPEQPGYRLLATTRLLRIASIVVSGVAAPEEIELVYREQGIFAFVEKQTFDRRTFLDTIQAARKATEAGSSELEGLSEREREVLALLAQGLTNKAIAEALIISPNTVKRHVKAIYRKLDIHTRSAAAARAVSSED